LQVATETETANTIVQVVNTSEVNNDTRAHINPVREDNGRCKLLQRRMHLTLEHRHRRSAIMQEARLMVQACTDRMGKVESDNAKLIQKDAEENERNIRKRKEEREEKTQAAADKKVLAEKRASGTKKTEKRASGKKVATPRKEAKKKLSPAAKRIKERHNNHEKKKAKKEKEIEERRTFLMSEGLTAAKMLDDDESVGDDDMEWTEDQFEVAGGPRS
jgi:hypothetical protein